MKNIFERSGKGLNYKGKKQKENEKENFATDNDEEDPEEEKTFEPLRVWQSPHNGGPPLGLPTQL